MEDIRVHVVDYGRKNLYMRYVDPNTGKQVPRSTGTSNPAEAMKKAGAWEKDLREGKYKPRSRVTWKDFRDEFESSEAYRDLADASQRKVLTTFKLVEEILSPDRLEKLTTKRIEDFAAGLRARGQADFTIKGYLSILRMALNWAADEDRGLLNMVPKFKMPKRARGSKMMKGRAITGEEYDRMVAAIPSVVRARNVAKWQRLLEGLWLSGLRLGEAVDLWWDRLDRMHVVLTGRRPMLRIHADQEKGGQDRLLPITPDFAEFLSRTPERERTGRVFELGCRGIPTISDVISKIGEKAKVVVDAKSGKFASAHDFRRAFGSRWGRKVMPAVLQVLMRHADIKTTMKFYAEQDAEETADVVWEAAGASDSPAGSFSGSTPSKTEEIHR